MTVRALSVSQREPGHPHPLCPSWSARCDVPWYQLTTYEGRSFVCVCNSLSDSLKDTELSVTILTLTITSTHFSSLITNTLSALEVVR